MDETLYTEKLVPYLVHFACSDRYVAGGIVIRALWGSEKTHIQIQLAKALIAADCESIRLALKEVPRIWLIELKKVADMETEEKKQ